MKTLRHLAGALGAFSRAFRRRPNSHVQARRLDGLGVSKIRAGATKKSDDPVDLASGAPSFHTPLPLKDGAVQAIQGDHNQYAHPSGDRQLRQLIANQIALETGNPVDCDRELTITCGTSAALAGVLTAILDPGDEVILFAPFFESYASQIRFAQGTPRYVPLTQPDWTIDFTALARAFNRRTRALIINTPNNPTGRVFTDGELTALATLCAKHGVTLISDEIYSRLVYGSSAFTSLWATGRNRARNIVVDGLSKAYNATGWRVGYVLAGAELTDAFRVVHSLFGLSAPTPLQVAARNAFLPETLSELAETVSACREARDRLCQALTTAGFRLRVPEGATYVLADASHLGARTDEEARDLLIERTGVSSVPGSYFFETPPKQHWLRFCFARDRAVIDKAVGKLQLL